jgi:hypothetical protein
MNKHIFSIIGILSLFVLGSVSPASASAATLLDAEGEPVEPGSYVTLTAGTLVSTYPGSGSTTCNNVVLQYKVGENGPEQVSLMPGTITRGACVYQPGNLSVVLLSALLYSPIDLSEGEGSGTFQFTERLESFLTCTFKGDFDFTYEAETDILSVPGSTLAGEGAGCPTSEVVQGDFALTNGLGKVTIN